MANLRTTNQKIREAQTKVALEPLFVNLQARSRTGGSNLDLSKGGSYWCLTGSSWCLTGSSWCLVGSSCWLSSATLIQSRLPVRHDELASDQPLDAGDIAFFKQFVDRRPTEIDQLATFVGLYNSTSRLGGREFFNFPIFDFSTVRSRPAAVQRPGLV